MIAPETIRDANWETIRGHLEGDRERVWLALSRLGPCTTRALAERSGMYLLSVRPRVSELVELGLAECVGRNGRDGIYDAVSLDDASAAHARRASDKEQLALL